MAKVSESNVQVVEMANEVDQKGVNGRDPNEGKKRNKQYKYDGSAILNSIEKIGESFTGARRYVRTYSVMAKRTEEYKDIVFTGMIARVDLVDELVCFVHERFGRSSKRLIIMMMKNLIEDLNNYDIEVYKPKDAE